MKNIFCVLVLLISVTPNFAQVTPIPMDGTDCSNLFFNALLEEDAKGIENLISNDFTVVGFYGQTIDAVTLRQSIANGYLTVESGQLTGTLTRSYGDVAVISGRWNVRAKIENNNFQGELAYMTVCVRSGGKWKVTAAQLTPTQ